MNKFPTIIIILMLLQVTASCSFFLPWPMSTVFTVGDLVLAKETGKSSSEHIVGKITGKECQWVRVLDGEDVCMTNEKYEDYLFKMNCEEYNWNILGLPSCKDGIINKKQKYDETGPW